jgi:transposase
MALETAFVSFSERGHIWRTLRRLEVIFFPPACPDLNPQEHVWKMTRQAVSHHHTFPDFPALCHAFRNFLDHTPFLFDWFRQYVPPVLRQFVFG